MKIVKIKGGLGNQLFQYSFATLIRKMSGDEIKLDMSTFKDMKEDTIRKPRLLKFNISFPIANECEINNICLIKHKGDMLSTKYRIGIGLEALINRRYYFEKNRDTIDPKTVLDYEYLDGYWQGWKYVESIWSELRPQLEPNYNVHESTQRYINHVKSIESVFVGIRRGDYTTAIGHFGSFGNSYYQRAMNYVTEQVSNPVFFVFSNDIPWVKDNIDFSKRNVVFREAEDVVDDFEDLLIMASCKHSIIINSTYHWWGARINDNPGKIVVAPGKWFFDNKTIDIVPPNWIRIDP